MVSAAAESVVSTILVGITCLMISSLLVYFIRMSNRTPDIDAEIDKYVKYCCILSISCFLCRSFGIFIMCITTLSRGEMAVIMQNTEKISIIFHNLAYAFQGTLYIRRLQLIFEDSMFAYPNSVIYALYGYLSFMLLLTFISGIMRFLDNETVKPFTFFFYIYIFLGRMFDICVLFLFCRKLLILMISSYKTNLKNLCNADLYKAVTNRADVGMDIVECMAKWIVTYFVAVCVVLLVAILARMLSTNMVENEFFISHSALSITNFVNAYCLFLTFGFAKKQYQTVCRYADSCCISCCFCCVLCRLTEKKLNINVVRSMGYHSGEKEKSKSRLNANINSIKLEASNSANSATSQTSQIEME